MRQAFRRYAFPMMIIAAVLAAALPLNCFAAESFVFSDFAYDVFNVLDFNYVSIPSLGISESMNHDSYHFSKYPGALYGVYLPLDRSLFDASGIDSLSLDFYLPIFVPDVSSIDFEIYYGLNFPGSGMNLNALELESAIIMPLSSGTSIDADIVTAPSTYSVISDDRSITYNLTKTRISYSSSSFFDVSYILLRFDVSGISSLPNELVFSVVMSSTSTLTTLSANASSIIKSLSVISSLLNNYVAAEIQTDAHIIELLESISDYFNSTDSGSSESEGILADGEEKQQELEQLGDALSNVPKPSIQNITQSFDPADTLISADPGMVQNALSIVYSWDKFLILLGLFIAVGTISYIIFGKKS